MTTLRWVKSSRSQGNGECVEVAWVKSSLSNANGTCVEVASCPHGLAIRDSKDKSGPILRTDAGTWTGFLATLR